MYEDEGARLQDGVEVDGGMTLGRDGEQQDADGREVVQRVCIVRERK